MKLLKENTLTKSIAISHSSNGLKRTCCFPIELGFSLSPQIGLSSPCVWQLWADFDFLLINQFLVGMVGFYSSKDKSMQQISTAIFTVSLTNTDRPIGNISMPCCLISLHWVYFFLCWGLHCALCLTLKLKLLKCEVNDINFFKNLGLGWLGAGAR
jgi:hypothetical protein